MPLSDLYLVRSGVTGWEEFPNINGIRATGRAFFLGSPSGFFNIQLSGTGFFLQILGGSGNSCQLYDFIGGGTGNIINFTSPFLANFNAISAGRQNTVSGQQNFVGAGVLNKIGGTNSFIGAGNANIGSGNHCAVVAGNTNIIVNDLSIIGAGTNNIITSQGGAILAGASNVIWGQNGFIGAGSQNFITGANAVIVGGALNESNGLTSFVGGGTRNIAGLDYSVVCGGFLNIASGITSSILGGDTNTIWSGVISAVIVGGVSNTISGCSYATIWGQSNKIINGTSSYAGGSTNQVFAGTGFAFGFSNIISGEKAIVLATFGRVRSTESGAMVLGDAISALKFPSGANSLAMHFAGGVWITGGAGFSVQHTSFFGGNINLTNTGAIFQNTLTGIQRILATTGNVQILGSLPNTLIIANQYVALSGAITGDLNVNGNIFSNGVLIGGINRVKRVQPGAYPYFVNASDEIVGINSSARRDIFLPTAIGNTGKFYYFKDEFGAAATGVIKLIPTGGQTIDGATGYLLNINRMAITVYSDNSNWFIL
jgi:hypothetical protein